MKKALITGITGQDGSYLAEFLLEKGYEVHGIIRRSSSFNTGRIQHIFEDIHKEDHRLHLHHGDMGDGSSLNKLMRKIRPQEIYNLAAQSHVRVSFDTPEYTTDVTALGTLRLLDAIRDVDFETKLYQASSSEMFGAAKEVPQSEKTSFYPRSPYGCSKVYSYWICVNYRESYNMFISNGILFNHESPRRGKTFVTRKITQAVAKIHSGKQKCLYLGNLDAKRDWGYAKDYVDAMWMILQHKTPDDFVIATGETHTVREFCERAFGHVDIHLEWKGEGTEELGIDSKTGEVLIQIDPRYFRPAEVDILLGDSSKARETLGWKPKVSFRELVKIMMEEELKNC